MRYPNSDPLWSLHLEKLILFSLILNQSRYKGLVVDTAGLEQEDIVKAMATQLWVLPTITWKDSWASSCMKGTSVESGEQE